MSWLVRSARPIIITQLILHAVQVKVNQAITISTLQLALNPVQTALTRRQTATACVVSSSSGKSTYLLYLHCVHFLSLKTKVNIDRASLFINLIYCIF